MPDGLIQAAMRPDWAEAFTRATGKDPAALGIKTEEEAQRHLLAIESARKATPGPTSVDPSNHDWRGVGATNAGIDAKGR